MNKLSKKERTRAGIMHTAKGLFESYGIENVTFSQIADGAGVCRTTVFNHFCDSKELMLALTCQEILDVKEHCLEEGYKGKDMAYGIFTKLIDDAALYPKLTATLMTNAILSREENNPIKTIEKMIIDEFADEYGEDGAEQMAVLVSGAYYGLINHYHINNKTFDGEIMKQEFKKLLEKIIK